MNLIANISPPKCGTTALYHCLARSKSTSKPTVKEPRFFAHGENQNHGDVPDYLKLSGSYERGIKWHDALFNDQESHTYRLDFTTYYSTIQQSPALIKKHYPNAKFVFILRDPVERFVSHYYEFSKAGVKVPDISAIINGDCDVSRWMFDFANYQETYQRYSELFGEESICLIKFDDLKFEPKKLEDKVCEFFELTDFEFRPNETEKNLAGRAKSDFLQIILRGSLTKAISKIIPSILRARLLALRKKLVLMNTKTVSNPTLSPSDLKVLRTRLGPQYDFLKSLNL
jgi:hypothetical protein